MCGIAGAVCIADFERLACAMSLQLQHRGPDDAGVLMLRGASGQPLGTFAHRRLAIIDPSPAGHQPMSTANERYTLVFNGEIYNFRELRDELKQAGEAFSSGTDTEVLLRGWCLHGVGFARRLRGMFAFALWDREEEKLWLVRDSFGIKPLYIAQVGSGLLFASELRAVLASGQVARVLSSVAVASYLQNGSVLEPATAIQGISMVPAGTAVSIDLVGGQAQVGKPFMFSDDLFEVGAYDQDVADIDCAAARVRKALRESVAAHLVSDVPVGFFLSGGLDSSAVVALAAEVTSRQLNTFTLIFDEAAYSESAPARAVSRRFGTHHTEVSLRSVDLLAALPEIFAAMDQPTMDGVNTYLVSRAVRRAGIKVALSGLGGDELFAGYPSFRRASYVARIWPALQYGRSLLPLLAAYPAGVARDKFALLLTGRYPSRAAYTASRLLFGSPQVTELLRMPTRETECYHAPEWLSLLQQVSWYETTGYMRNTLLRDSDVFSMVHGVEIRVPMVDAGVAAAAASVDDHLKLSNNESKPLLVAAVRDLLPRAVWNRPKQGFSIPFDGWLRTTLRDEVRASFEPKRLETVGLSALATHQVWSDFLGRRRSIGWGRPWALYTLIRWAEQNGVTAA